MCCGIIANPAAPAVGIEGGDRQSRLAQPRVHLRYRIGPVLRVEQQVVQAGVPALDNVLADAIEFALERVALRKLLQQCVCPGDTLARGKLRAGNAPQEFLHLVDRRAPVGTVDHQVHRPALLQRARQNPQPFVRVGQMVQHPGTVDEIEQPERERRNVLDRRANEPDIVQRAQLASPACDRKRRFAEIKCHHFAAGLAKLLGEKHCRIARAATRDEHAESLVETFHSAVAVEIDDIQDPPCVLTRRMRSSAGSRGGYG